MKIAHRAAQNMLFTSVFYSPASRQRHEDLKQLVEPRRPKTSESVPSLCRWKSLKVASVVRVIDNVVHSERDLVEYRVNEADGRLAHS